MNFVNRRTLTQPEFILSLLINCQNSLNSVFVSLLPGPEARDTEAPEVPHLIGHRVGRDNRRRDAAKLVGDAGEETLLLLRDLLLLQPLLLLLAETRKLLHELVRPVE